MHRDQASNPWPYLPQTYAYAPATGLFSGHAVPRLYGFPHERVYHSNHASAVYPAQVGTPLTALTPVADPATAWLTDRQATQKLALDDVISQIHGRAEIYQQRMAEIENAKCAAFNRAFSWHLPPEQPPDAFDPQLHRLLQDLYREQRDERSKFWSDLSRLRQSLPETLQTYLTAKHRQALLQDSPGDAM